MSSDQPEAGVPADRTTANEAPDRGTFFGRRIDFRILVPALIVIDVLALFLFPPFPKDQPGQPCSYPVCYIGGNLELPAPHVVWDLSPATAPPASDIVQFHPSITSTLLTMWIVMLVILVIAIAATRSMRIVPGGIQNVFEMIYELLADFGTGLGGAAARPYIPIFFGFFIFIIVSNYSGLIPPVGKLDELRAPTSDVNVTIGLALVAFGFFEYQGFRKLGVRGYLSKFFPIGEFRHGLGAGVIAMFVGLIELLLEFVKPLTLSMRLFGNIFGGEVALGVMTGLTVAIVPVALLGLELILNFAQALIFSVLTLMFTVLAIESHEENAGEAAEAALHGDAPAPAGASSAG